MLICAQFFFWLQYLLYGFFHFHFHHFISIHSFQSWCNLKKKKKVKNNPKKAKEDFFFVWLQHLNHHYIININFWCVCVLFCRIESAEYIFHLAISCSGNNFVENLVQKFMKFENKKKFQDSPFPENFSE